MRKLKDLRKEKKLTQKVLAEILNVSNSSISDWEKGRIKPHIDVIEQVAKYFNVSIDYLVGREDGVTYPKRYIEATEDEKDLLYTYRNLSDEYKDNLKTMLNVLKKATNKN